MNAAAMNQTTWAARLGNVAKTTVLLAAMSALTLAIGQQLGGPRGLLWAGAAVLVMNFVSYWFSDRIALMMNGAKEVTPGALPHVERLLADLARRGDLPVPRLYLMNSPTPNAFATGRNPSRAAVAVTTGLLQRLSERELNGVLAHELAHVKNRDTLIMTVAATLAGVITQVAHMVFFWGGSLLRSSDDERDDGGSSLASLGVLLVAPIAATLLQLAISRSREYDADATAAQLTGDPRGLASALSRLESDNRTLPDDRAPAMAHLYIVNPLSGGGLMKLFSTHPPIDERIDRLLRLDVA